MPPCAPDISGDLPPPGVSPGDSAYDRFAIPSLDDLGVEPPAQALKFKGGEREALSRLESVMVSGWRVRRDKRSGCSAVFLSRTVGTSIRRSGTKISLAKTM